jgi:hypothetical protein
MRACLVCLAAWLYFPVAAFGQIDYDRHVIFDNSLADGSARRLNWRSATGGDDTAWNSPATLCVFGATPKMLFP